MGTESASRSSPAIGSAPSEDGAPGTRGDLAGAHPGARAPTGAALVLALSATVAGFGLVDPVAHWAIQPVNLPAPLPDQNQNAESLVFVVTFAVLLPLAAIFVPAILDRISRRHVPKTASGLALVLALTLCALLAAVKVGPDVSSASRPLMLFVTSAIWLALAAAGVGRLLSDRSHSQALVRIEPNLWPVLAVSLVAVLLCFANIASISVAPLVAGLVAAAAAGYWVATETPSFRAPPRLLRRGADVAAIALIALAVPNLDVLHPGGPLGAYKAAIIQFHQNLFLGPANALLRGGTMLVGVVSQYGVGSILFLAGVFNLIPIGYGTLALTEGVLAAGMFCLAYVTLRLAGVGVLLAWATLVVAIVVLVFNLLYPLGGLLQHGAFRFGMPMVILGAAAGEARVARGGAILAGIQVATVGMASLWSFEALLYSLGAVVGLAAFRVATAPAGRLRLIVRLALQVLVACAVVQLVFALATLAAAGELPQWGQYLTTLREFLTGRIGDLTYDFSVWSPGLAVGALYAASALALVLVVWREPQLANANRPALLILSGTTGYGLALFSYFVNRSADHILPYVSLPAVMIVALWITILLGDERFSRQSRGLALTSVLAGVAILVAVAWSGAGLRFSQSALAYAAPGGKSLGTAIHDLWHTPPLAPGAADATRMLETYMPGEHQSVVLTSPDLSVEALMRTQRVNAIPLTDPWEDSFVPDLHTSAVNDAVADLEPGRLMLIDQHSRYVLKHRDTSPAVVLSQGLAALQVVALRRIAERFKLVRVAESGSGVEVVELRPR